MTEYYPKSMDAEIATGLKVDFRVRLAEQLLYRMVEGGAQSGRPVADVIKEVFNLAAEFVDEGERRGLMEPSQLKQEDLVEQNIRMSVHAQEFSNNYVALRGGVGRTIPGRKGN